MFKRVFCLVLLLCCLSSAAMAEIRYVYNGAQSTSRLNLRERPDRSSPTLGLYYTGVRVQVMEDLGDWSRVRIAMGEADEYVEGYMSNAYLIPADWLGTCQLPLLDLVGSRAYVMAYSSSRLHVLFEDGTTGFIPGQGFTLTQPEASQRLLKERVCTPQQGAAIHNAAGQIIANLYGGIFLNDSIIIPATGEAMVSLQDENDDVRGLLSAGDWTYTDNGANCEEQYAAYESDTGLIEVLGGMADGRVILRLTESTEDAPRIVLTHGFNLEGLTRLTREGSYLRYTRPLRGEMTDNELISQVYARLDQAKLRTLSGCTAQVERLIDFQYGHRMLRVRFVNAQGVTMGIADFDGAVMIWQDEDNG